MLDAEEVDVDYFTPSSSTSLSTIFSSSTKEEDVLEKTSLKYNAPLPPQIATKPEEQKQTQYLFAGTVYAYKWANNTYEFRGRLGFAIYKIAGFDDQSIVIYDSNKTTLSSLTLTNNVVIKVNSNISISYYDNQQKFWSVNTSTSSHKKILEILRSSNVKLEFKPAVEDTENSTSIKEIQDKVENTIKKLEDEKESDTDGSFNKRTKDLLLKRMATMGQSVLPPPHLATAQTSDSSDTNEPLNQQKLRHKPKVMSKKVLLEKKTDTEKIIDQNAVKITSRSETSHETYKDILNIDENQQIVPVMTTNIINPSIDFSSDANSLGMFITEQKINNGELRMNINRMTDKLDLLLDKVKDLEISDKYKPTNDSYGLHTQFQNDIVQKLLHEYEKKINIYEEFMKSKGYDCNIIEMAQLNKDSHESFKNVPTEYKKLLQLCEEKEKEIYRLKEELDISSNREIQLKNYEKCLLKEIEELKIKNNGTADATTILKDTSSQQFTDIKIKLKEIMNDTFQAISANFDDEERYTGAKVKSIVGLVVKKTTIESLKEF